MQNKRRGGRGGGGEGAEGSQGVPSPPTPLPRPSWHCKRPSPEGRGRGEAQQVPRLCDASIPPNPQCFSSAHPLTLWTNWCRPRGSVPDPQGQSGGPEGPAVKAWGLLASKATNCAYRPTHPGDPFCWSRETLPGPQGQARVVENSSRAEARRLIQLALPG